MFIEPGSAWVSGYCRIFNSKLADELLGREFVYTLNEANVLMERWQIEYDTAHPQPALECRPPAPETIMPASTGSAVRRPTQQAWSNSVERM
jgi:putative transposase